MLTIATCTAGVIIHVIMSTVLLLLILCPVLININAGHGRLKSSLKEFKCPVASCSATFDRIGLLEIHSRIHQNRLFHCPFCPYSTTQSVNLVFHTRLHFGIADYACPCCDARFARKSILKNHFDTKHEGLKAICPACNFEGSMIGVYLHIARKHNLRGSWNSKTRQFTLVD